IKSRTLIPREDEDLEDEEEDPRAELVRRLLEYREFKKVSELLGDREQEWRGIFERGPSALPEAEDPGTESLDLTMLELYRAFRTVLSNRPDDTPFTLEPEEYSVEERTEAILAECDRNSEGVSFARLFEGTPSRANVITTFLALLELIRKRVLAVNQADLFGEIWLRRTEVGIPDDA
ncbi:MAG: segregation/condensation protein A, partial [Gemmatimonadota bacterium]|nr:segregation/condensation protein A [Gemmatimonadota bacterium]